MVKHEFHDSYVCPLCNGSGGLTSPRVNEIWATLLRTTQESFFNTVMESIAGGFPPSSDQGDQPEVDAPQSDEHD